MLMIGKEIPKLKVMSKSQINSWICCSMDIEKGDLNKIENRVMLKAKDTFEWSNEIEEYIIERSLMTQERN